MAKKDDALDGAPVQEVVPAGHRKVRVLGKGIGKIYTGVYDETLPHGERFLTHKKGEILTVKDDAADQLVERGFVDYEDDEDGAAA